MRILHTSDVHLGRQFNNLSLEEDHQAILDQMTGAIFKYEPDLLIIAGDVYDRAFPPASAMRQFNEFLTRIARETETAVAIIAGNHDSAALIGSMSIFTDGRRALIRGPLSADETPLVLEDGHGQVAISALPFGFEFAARQCFGVETISTPEDVVRAQVEAARRLVPEGARWVVVAHAFVAGASKSDGERPIARIGGIETVSPEVFDGAHYVALGHLHRPQKVGAPHIRYSGAPLGFGFDEEGNAKSMTWVDLDAAGVARIDMIPFVPLRQVRTLRGRMEELVLNERSNDLIKVVLTNETRLIDPMKQLREVFPNACSLVYASDEAVARENDMPEGPAKLDDPLEVVRSFVEIVRGEGVREDELELVASGLHDLKNAEVAA